MSNISTVQYGLHYHNSQCCTVQYKMNSNISDEYLWYRSDLSTVQYTVLEKHIMLCIRVYMNNIQLHKVENVMQEHENVLHYSCIVSLLC